MFVQVPLLCRHLATLSGHHHDQARLVDLLQGQRGQYLAQRLAYLCLCCQLKDGQMPELSDAEILNFEVSLPCSFAHISLIKDLKNIVCSTLKASFRNKLLIVL